MSDSMGGSSPSACIHQRPLLTCNHCHTEDGILHIGTNDDLTISRSLGGPLPHMHPPSHLQGLSPLNPLSRSFDEDVKAHVGGEIAKCEVEKLSAATRDNPPRPGGANFHNFTITSSPHNPGIYGDPDGLLTLDQTGSGPASVSSNPQDNVRAM
jgi:hypothetical protein